MMTELSERFVLRVVNMVPSLQPDLDRYRERMDEDIPLAGLLWFIWPTLVSRHIAPTQPDEENQLPAVLAIMEEEFGLDPRVDGVIDGCLEDMPFPGDPGYRAVDLLGPKLRTRLRELDDSGRRDPYAPEQVDIDFLGRLTAAVPGLQADLDAHIAEEGQLLPTSFLEELTEKTTKEYAEAVARGNELSAEGRGFLDFLEDAYGENTGDPVDNLIGVGFIESLPWHDERGHELINVLPPKLRAEYDRNRAAGPDPNVPPQD